METMAGDDRRTDNSLAKSYGWGTTGPVEDWLFAEGYRFDFFQAVRLLEMIEARDSGRLETARGEDENTMLPPRTSPGESAYPAKEMVRFKSAVSLDFPPSDIAGVSLEPPVRPRSRPRHTSEGNTPASMV